ncbi:MAG: D-alanine-D-alanine ligase [Actinomycetota bacterium]
MAEALVLFGGPSPEHDVSVLTGLQAARTLGASEALYWTRAGDFVIVDASLEGKDFADGVPRGAKPARITVGGGISVKGGMGREKTYDSVVVNCCHGGPGEDGTIQATLDLAGVAYTGPSVDGAALGMDKLAFGAACASAGIPVLSRVGFTDGTKPDFDGPYIVKPRFGGSSIGIEVVTDIETAWAFLKSNRHLARGAVIEPYRPESIDLNVAVRAYPSLELSAIEKPTRAGGDIYSYKEKYVGGEGMATAPRELPAQIPSHVEEKLRGYAREAAQVAGLRGVARIDFLLDGDTLFLNEINTIPGSLSWFLWVDPVVPFRQLLDDMIAEAAARPTAKYSAAGADGAVLRSGASIASKLA